MDPKLQTSDVRLQTSASARLDPVRVVLANGVAVLAKHTTTTPAVTMHLARRAGSTSDPADAPSAVHLRAGVLDGGRATGPADDFAADLDNRGIALAIAVTRQLFSIVCTCLAEDFEPVFALVGEIAMSPSVPDAELATRKS